MPDLGSIGSATPLAFQGGAVTTGARALSHVSVEAIVSSDGFPQAPVAQAQVLGSLEAAEVVGAIDVTETITAEVG